MTMRHPLIVFSLLLSLSATLWAQDNYVGYSPLFAPEFKADLPETVRETSGLFFHNGILWTHNDSGGKPVLYGLDTTTFAIVQTLTLQNVKNKDWEDVCVDDERVYVGDFGNNKGKRKDLRIYTFPLSAIPAEGNATVTVDSICFAFADQTSFDNKKYEHDYDCEAMFSKGDHLYLFSKGWVTGTTRLYRLDKSSGDQMAEVVNGFDSQGLITGADYDPVTGTLALVGYVNKVWLPFLYLIYDFNDDGVKLSNRRFELHNYVGSQTEGICFYAPGRCFLTQETSPTVISKVFSIDFRKRIAKDKEKNQ